MPFIDNAFDLGGIFSIDDYNLITDYTIPNFYENGNSYTVTSTKCYVVPKISDLFCKAIYKTLLDAGYEATYDSENYSITVLGFTFYCLARHYTNWSPLAVNFWIGTKGGEINDGATISDDSWARVDVGIKFRIRLRGDENGFMLSTVPTIYYDQLDKYPLYDRLILYIYRGYNLVNKEIAWMFGSDLGNSERYFKTTSNEYKIFSSGDSTHTYNHSHAGTTTDSRCPYLPLFDYYGTIYIPSFLKSYSDYHDNFSYYKIDNKIYWKVSCSSTSGYVTYGKHGLIHIS